MVPRTMPRISRLIGPGKTMFFEVELLPLTCITAITRVLETAALDSDETE